MNRKILLLIFALFYSGLFAQNIPLQYKEAMDAYSRNDFTLAVKLFDSFGKYYTIDDEFSSTAYYYLGLSLIKLEKIDASISAFEFFVNKYTWSNFRDDALYALGKFYFEKADYSNCRERLIVILNDYPESEFVGPANYFIGESFSAEENYDNAVQYLTKCYSIKTNNKYIDFSLYSLGYVNEKLSKYKNAVAYYDTLLTYFKSSSLAPEAQVRIGICYFKLKDYDNAVLELSDPSIDELPQKQYDEAKFILANSFYRLKEYNDAQTTFNKLIEKNPSTYFLRESKYGLAWCSFQQQKYENAYGIFDNLSKSGNDSIAINSFFWSAECKRYYGKESEANLIYEEFLRRYPNSSLIPRVQLQLGIINFDEQKQYAEQNLNAALSSNDIYVKVKALTILGELKLNQKYFNVAKNCFLEALELSDVNPDLYLRDLLGSGVSSYYLKDYTETIATLNKLHLKNSQFESDKVNFYLAESYFSKNDFVNANKYYSKIDETNKELLPQLLLGRGYTYFNLKDYNNASFCFLDFSRNYKNNPNFNNVRLRLADSYYGMKKYAEAGRVYKEIFLSDDAKLNNDYAHYQYAQALYKSGNDQEAIQEFLNLQVQFPNSKYLAESQYVIGWIYFQKGNFDAAISNYQILYDKYPQSPLVPMTYNSIGNSYFNISRYDSAIVYYNKVLSDFPNSNYVFDAIMGIKDSYIAADKPDQAVSLIDTYIAGNPKTSFADQLYFKKAEIYYSLGNYEKAKQTFKDFVYGYSNSTLVPDAYYWIGKSAANLKQNEEALTNFSKAANFKISSEIGISAVLEIGKIYSENKNYDAAIGVYEKAINELPPESPKVGEIMYNRALAYIAKGDVSKAYEDFNYIIQYQDGTIFAANSKYEIGLIELARKNYETCDMIFRELSENRNDDLGAKAQYFYGESLFDQNKIDDAISSLVRVRFNFSAYDEWLTKSYLKLGECFEKKEDLQKAKELYRTVLTRHQGDEYGKQAKKKLQALE
jgi:TolA-binding protein